MSGVHHPLSQVKVHWGSSTGPVLATTTANASGGFTAEFAIPDAPEGTYILVSASYDEQGNVLHSSPWSFTVTAPPELTVEPGAGLPSSTVQVKGAGFGLGPVELRWDSDEGPLLRSTYGRGFTVPVDIPAAARGTHKIVATGLDFEQRVFGRASASFDVMVTPADYPLPPKARADTVGPAIAGAALSAGNRNRIVSRKGYVTLFCGRFDEVGVTGRCGARSLRRVRMGTHASARRAAVLTLRGKSFTAQKGKPVRVRFRLSRKAMAGLRRARKVRMRGHVTSRDRTGNESKAGFRFSLKAPRRQRGVNASPAGGSW